MWWRKPEEHWILVKVFKNEWQMRSNNSITGVAYIYLLESNEGNRKIDFKHNCKGKLNIEIFDSYLETVYPWLNGKNDRDIPTYWDLAQERQLKYIKGFYRFITRIGD